MIQCPADATAQPAARRALLRGASLLPLLRARTGRPYLAPAGLLLALLPNHPAVAACTQSGSIVTCTPGSAHTARLGNSDPSDNLTINVQDNAQVTVGNDNAISLGDNAVITLGADAVVSNNATSGSGRWGTGNNAIEFGSNGRLTIGAGGIVSALGTQNNGEPINVMGTGNVITNYGTITSRSGAAIWFEDRTTEAGNTIDNYGLIETQLGANSNVIGNQARSNVTFINRTGAVVRGTLSFASGDDALILETGSIITGGFEGGAGTNRLSLSGDGDDSLPGDIRNFQLLTKEGTGTWTLTGAVGANSRSEPLQMLVNQGRLVLTGNNANFNGSVTVNPAGTLEARAQSLPPSILDNGLVRFAQDLEGAYEGVISGTGAVEKTLGGNLTLAGTNSYSGGTAINAGTLFVTRDANLGAAAGGLTLNGGTLATTVDMATARATTLGPGGGGLRAAAGTTLTHGGAIAGGGSLTLNGPGTVILSGANSYGGATILDAGTLQVADNRALGVEAAPLTFSGGTLRTTAGMAIGRAATIDADGGTIETRAGTTLSYGSDIAGAGQLTKTGAGTLRLTGTNSHGGTAINGGIVEAASDASLGAAEATLSFDGGTLRSGADLVIARNARLDAGGGTVETATGTSLTFAGAIAGAGGLTQSGGGTTLLTGSNSYTGATTVAAGRLYIDGDQSAATGAATALSGARLGGSGIIGGNAIIRSGATLSPGPDSLVPGTLTIRGDLTLEPGATALFNLAMPGVGAVGNDLVNVGGNLTLGGTLNVNVTGQSRSLRPGVYRLFNYDGTLGNPAGLALGGFTSDGVTIGAPFGSNYSIQTVVPNQVNLINSAGLALTYWDGDAGPKNDDLIQGGDGTWHRLIPAGSNDWTDAGGAVNAGWSDGGFAIFTGTGGAVRVDTGDGAVIAEGMQFLANGYRLSGDPITLSAPADPLLGDQSLIRVQRGVSATIDNDLVGQNGEAVSLGVTDGGTLVLGGNNQFTALGVADGGTLQVAQAQNFATSLGLVLGDGSVLHTTASLTNAGLIGIATLGTAAEGTIDTDAGTTLTQSGFITDLSASTPGVLTKAGQGTLTLTSDGNVMFGSTRIEGGTLQLGTGGTAGWLTSAGGIDVEDGGRLAFDRSDTRTFEDTVSGAGAIAKSGSGTIILTADNSLTGTTTIAAGTLQLGAGGTSGVVAGPIVDNGTLAISRSDDITLANAISGSGALVHSGSGRTILTGANSYAGSTTVASGRLYIDGDQGAATGAATAMAGTRLGGSGVIGGDVAIQDGATLSPGSDSLVPGTLTINGSLTLAPNATLLYNLANPSVGGPGNDLVTVGRDLTLDGTLNIVAPSLRPGVYRLFNYGGTLTDNGLTLGGFTSDGTTITGPLDGFTVQTVIPRQVNLVYQGGLPLTYWDGRGDGATKNNGRIEGGDGIWTNPAVGDTNNWTDLAGGINAPWADDDYAVFAGVGGTVRVDASSGPVRVWGLQVASDGYVLEGDPLTLRNPGVQPYAFIRVGDGTRESPVTVTINNDLIGDADAAVSDGGTLVLNGDNAFGTISVLNGSVVRASRAENVRTSWNGVGLIILADGSTLQATQSFSLGGIIGIGAFSGEAAGRIDTDAGVTLTLNGGIAEAAPNAAFTKGGAGRLALTLDANAITGATTIAGGTLQLGNGGASGWLSTSSIDVEAGTRLSFNRSDTRAVDSPITGAGAVEQAGTGTIIIAADESYTGGTTISAGTLQIGNGGTTGHVIGDILNNATLVINRGNEKLTPGVISGIGRLIQAGTGTTVLQADNSYTGGTIINAGRLMLGDGGTAGSIVGNVENNAVLAFNRSDTLTYGGIISGSGTLQQLGSGTVILTGANTTDGGTLVAAGTLQIGAGGTSGQLFGPILNNGTVVLNRSDDIPYASAITGTGRVIKQGAGIVYVTGANVYTGGTLINAGRVEVGTGGTSGSFVGDVVDNGQLAVNRSDSFLINGVISGTGSFEQKGAGTTVFGANNSYTGGTLISGGTLQIGNGGTTGLVPGDVVNNGRLVINRANTKFLEGIVSGSGELVQAGLGTLIITNANSYSGGTAIEAGTLQISADDNLGAAGGPLRISGGTLHVTAGFATARQTTLAQQGGILDIDADQILTHSGVVTGGGGLTKAGAGTLILSGANDYARDTIVAGGRLQIDGDQTFATGAILVEDGATLGGRGIIGGAVSIAGGGTLAPGASPGTLTVNGDLALNPASVLDYEFGQPNVAGGALNDLTLVAGNLVLDGTLNVTAPSLSLDPGIYRVFDYAGSLTDNGLAVGTIPATGFSVQTSVPGQVNLVVTSGLTLNYWDGAAGPKNDGTVNGGDGRWQAPGGNDNWTTDSGTPNAPYGDGAYAVFAGTGGAVAVDAALGAINAAGMQFAADGYVVAGDAINLVGAGSSIIRVGDDSADGAGMTATISAPLTGTSGLTKADLGTLILSGTNSYAGGTIVAAGVLQIASDASLGAAAGGLTLDGGTLRTTADLAIPRATSIASGGGSFDTAAGTTLTLSGVVSGPGALAKAGDGTLILAADADPAGGTTIRAGTVQLGNGGTSGSLSGDVANDGVLAINRADALTLAGTISGTGGLVQAGRGTTTLTGANSYAGPTNVTAGTLLVNGDHSAAPGLVSVASGGTIGGTGIIGGDLAVADGGTLAPGQGAGTLTVNGNLSLAAGSRLAYSFGEANAVGGALNDLTIVGGDVVLDGTIDVAVTPGGAIGPGVYRVISYAGALTDNGLSIGATPANGFSVQTAIPNQINLVFTPQTGGGEGSSPGGGAGSTLSYWDGAAGPKADGIINGGDGLWQASPGNDNWTDAAGAENAPFRDRSFAVFAGAAGAVTVDRSLGAIAVSGMQFMTGGYVIGGEAIDLAEASSVIRVGDGTAAGAGMTATIDAVLAGSGELAKTDLGTLILTADNGYAGGTRITGGVVEVARDASLGAAAGGLTLDGGTLRTTADFATARATSLGPAGGTIETEAGTTLTLDAAISGSGGLTKRGDGTLILRAASDYAGPTGVAAGTLALRDTGAIGGPVSVAAEATLGGYGTIRGDVANAGTFAVADALGAFVGIGTGRSVVTGRFVNAGTARLAGAAPGNRLVVGSYVGERGVLHLNTMLAGDGAPTDQLVINGGTATGFTALSITNAGGVGADTPGNGIEVIVAAAGATTAPEAFALADRLVAGPYQYDLFRGGRDGSSPESWFLRSQRIDTGPSTGSGGGEGPQEPPAPPDPQQPLYRPEVPTYTATPALALMFGRTLIGTLHDRVGEREQLAGRHSGTSAPGGAWGRMLGQRNRWTAARGASFQERPAFQSSNYGLQAGVDLVADGDAGGGMAFAGLYGAYGWTDAVIQNDDLSRAGHAKLKSYSAGLYGTLFGADGWYVDAVAQVSRYELRAGSGFFADMRTRGTGLAASLEAGLPVGLGGGFSLQPQAQMIAQTIHVRDTADAAAAIRFDDVRSLTGRVGFRLVHHGARDGADGPRPVTSWLRLNLWREFAADPRTSFSSGADFVPFRSNLKGSWAEFGAGASAEMTRGAQLFANSAYQTGIDQNFRSWDVKLGLRFNW